MQRRGVVQGIAAALISAPAAGCLGIAGSEPANLGVLEMQIVDVRSPRAGFTSATIPVVFEIRNTSDDVAVPGPTVEYRGFVNGTEVAKAREEVASLEPGEKTSQRFQLIVSYDEVGETLVNAIQNGEFTVSLEGELRVDGETRTFEEGYEFR